MPKDSQVIKDEASELLELLIAKAGKPMVDLIEASLLTGISTVQLRRFIQKRQLQAMQYSPRGKIYLHLKKLADFLTDSQFN